MPPERNLYIVAGPNGAGKTTFARTFLPKYAACRNFVNADLIAQGLAPFDPQRAAVKAGRLVLLQIRQFARAGTDFGFETTLSGRAYLNLLGELKASGYRLHFFFLWVSDSKLAIARIRDRVAAGGHAVPAEDVRRRFARSIENFFTAYRHLGEWMLFDNSGPEPLLVARCGDGDETVVHRALWETIKPRGEKGS